MPLLNIHMTDSRPPRRRRGIAPWFALTALMLALAGCGGDGGGGFVAGSGGGGGGGGGGGDDDDDVVVTQQSVKVNPFGGAPLQNAIVTLVAANGEGVCNPDDPDNASSAFTCNVTGLTAPYVVSATGILGDTTVTLVGLSGKDGDQTINVTPITTAIAAKIAGTDPIKLVTDPAVRAAAQITEQKVTETANAYASALADVMIATGTATPTGEALLSGELTFGNPLDRLLDEVKVNVLPNGDVELSTVAGAATTQDPGAVGIDVGEADGGLTNVLVVQASGALPTAADAAKLPPPEQGQASTGGLAALQAAFNQCFALPQASRTGATGPCAQVVIDGLAQNARRTDVPVPGSFMNNGQTAAEAHGPLLASPDMDGAIFNPIEVIQTYPNDKAWVHISYTDKNGVLGSLDAPAIVQQAAADGGWRLIGNQRQVLTRVYTEVRKWNFVNAARATTGVNAYVNTLNILVGTQFQGADIVAALVEGPGLRGGVVLKPSNGVCNRLAVAGQLQDGELLANPSAIRDIPRPDDCVLGFRLNGIAQNASGPAITWPANTITANQTWAQPMLIPAEIAAIRPFSTYTYKLYQLDGNGQPFLAVIYSSPIRTAPLNLALAGQYGWNNADAAMIARMTPGNANSAPAGSEFPASWTTALGVPAVANVTAQVRSSAATPVVSGGAKVKPVLASGVTASASVPADLGASFPAVNSVGVGGYVYNQLAWTNTLGQTFGSVTQY